MRKSEEGVKVPYYILSFFESIRNMNKSQGGSLKKHLIFCRIVNEQVFIIIVFDCVDRLVNKFSSTRSTNLWQHNNFL